MQKGREWIGDGAGDQIAKKLGTKIRPGQLVSATVPCTTAYTTVHGIFC